MLEMNTFSVSARCQKTGMLGVAVSTAVPGVGGICPFVKQGVGAVATQSWVNPYLGIDGLQLLRQGLSAQAVLDKLLAEDPALVVWLSPEADGKFTPRTLPDDAFRPLGLTNGQFSLMMSLNSPEPANFGSVAAVLSMDRTTLTAALKPLLKTAARN